MHVGFQRRLRLAVGIATKGRPDMVCAIVGCLENQTRAPDGVLVATPDAAGVAGTGAAAATTWIPSPAGLTKQRNCILREASGFDIVVFFDDDFLPQSTYLDELEQLFLAHRDVVMATGHVIADGIIGPGFRMDEAQQFLDTDCGSDLERRKLVDVYNGYGCNMAVRMSAVREGGVAFDENLPLYGWLEDVDFSRRLSRFGRVVLSAAARGVHLGTKSGRQSGIRLGYSQIANPVYLVRKGTFAWFRAIWQMGRNVAMNVVFSLYPDPHVDRRGRLRGNAIAIRDLALGRLNPERILVL
jgi:GT2 family glycosyltransferase